MQMLSASRCCINTLLHPTPLQCATGDLVSPWRPYVLPLAWGVTVRRHWESLEDGTLQTR